MPENQGHLRPGELISTGLTPGDDFNNAMMTINRALTDPGSYVADAIADNIGRIGAGIIRQGVNYLFRLVVDRHLPDWAQRVVYITTDLTTALSP